MADAAHSGYAPDGWREFPYTDFDAKKRPLVDALEPEPADREAWALRLRPAIEAPAAKQVAQVTSPSPGSSAAIGAMASIRTRPASLPSFEV